jgi:hypothetical protein
LKIVINPIKPVLGMLASIIFLIGLGWLLITNEQMPEQLKSFSLTIYNFEGLTNRIWAVLLLYTFPGLLSSAASVKYLFGNSSTIIKVSALFHFVSGITWLSFGVFPYVVTDNFSIAFMIIRIFTFLISSSAGLILLGAEFYRISKNRYLGWYTIVIGVFIGLLGTWSLFSLDESWLRTNGSIASYFIWLGIYCLFQVRGKSWVGRGVSRP